MVVRARLIDWWRRRRFTEPRIDQVRWYASQADLPASLPRHELAVVGDSVRPKWAVLECPCGAGHRLQVNLSPHRQPCWRVILDAGVELGLYPSVDFDAPERRCHFWLRDGRVQWV